MVNWWGRAGTACLCALTHKKPILILAVRAACTCWEILALQPIVIVQLLHPSSLFPYPHGHENLKAG